MTEERVVKFEMVPRAGVCDTIVWESKQKMDGCAVEYPLLVGAVGAVAPTRDEAKKRTNSSRGSNINRREVGVERVTIVYEMES